MKERTRRTWAPWLPAANLIRGLSLNANPTDRLFSARYRLATIIAALLAAPLSYGAQRPTPNAEPSLDNSQARQTMSDSATHREDIRQVLQSTLDLDILNKYYHPEIAGRVPLCLAKNEAISFEPDLVKFGQPVRSISASEKSENMACLEIRELQILGDLAKVEFSYEIEGIRGTATFRKLQGSWQATERHLVER